MIRAEENTKEQKLPKGITRCKDGRYQARYTCDGHRYSLYGRDVEELAFRLEQAKQQAEEKKRTVQQYREMLLLREQERPRCGLTLNQWYELWLNEYKCTTVKQGTVDSYRCMYEYYIRDTLGDKLLTEIRSDELQHFFNDMNRSGYSKSTLSLTSVVIGSMFRQAVKNDLIGRNPVDACILPRGRKKVVERQALSEQQQERLLEAAQGNPVEGILRLALGTGMRIGEITGLQWSDIDWKKKELYVRTTLKQHRDKRDFYLDLPKTGSSTRTIPLLDDTIRVLKSEQMKRREEKKEAGVMWRPLPGMEQLVFLQKDGTPVSGQLVRQQLGRLIDEMNGVCSSAVKRKAVGSSQRIATEPMPHLTPHVLRHTFATRAIERGIPPKVVQELLGHSSITMTLDLYTHVLPQTKAEEMKKLDCLF